MKRGKSVLVYNAFSAVRDGTFDQFKIIILAMWMRLISLKDLIYYAWQ
ncbi:ankyrin repeat family protein [Lactiplantibacillus plantarum subsp. plantarum]|nr:ankyrin repeat family protein [Lactiplantibacillus plantarum subsp. plantarum]